MNKEFLNNNNKVKNNYGNYIICEYNKKNEDNIKEYYMVMKNLKEIIMINMFFRCFYLIYLILIL